MISATSSGRPRRRIGIHRAGAGTTGVGGSNRIDKGESGILQVVAVTNPLGLGYEQALVGVKTSGSPESVADEVARWPEADYVVATAGQFDLVVELVAADRRHLLELTSRLRSLPDVVSTETFMYLEMWKQLYDWGTRG